MGVVVPALQIPPMHGNAGVTATGVDAVERAKRGLAMMETQHVAAGLWSDARNRYGESIARYAYYHTSSMGAAPGWIKSAKNTAGAPARSDSAQADIYDAAITGELSAISAALAKIGQEMQAKWEAEVVSAGLVETGDLRDAMDWQTNARWHTRPAAQPATRTKRRFGSLTSAQQLYQMYHKGRSRSMTALRKSTPWETFQRTYKASWSKAGAQGRKETRAAIQRSAREAQAANRSSVPGRKNRSRARQLQFLLNAQLHGWRL